MGNFKERLEKIKDRIYRNLEGNTLGDDDDGDKMTAAEIAQGMKLLEVNGVLVEPIEPGDGSKYLGSLDDSEDPGLPTFDTAPDVLPN